MKFMTKSLGLILTFNLLASQAWAWGFNKGTNCNTKKMAEIVKNDYDKASSAFCFYTDASATPLMNLFELSSRGLATNLTRPESDNMSAYTALLLSGFKLNLLMSYIIDGERYVLIELTAASKEKRPGQFLAKYKLDPKVPDHHFSFKAK